MKTLQVVSSFFVGVLFAVGLAISGMTQPEKVIGFLDLRHWDPSLIFVMVGAIAVHAVSRPFVMRRAAPVLDREFHLPTRKDIDRSLIVGAVIFGLGWGLGGYCPGPALTSLFAGDVKVWIFVSMMIVGMWISARRNKAKP